MPIPPSLDPVFGYLSLGLIQDAWDELENLPPDIRMSSDVMTLRIEMLQRMEKWETARMLAESMAKRCPENPTWWISWAYALRRETTVESAREVLLRAYEIHPKVPLIVYNLACYASVLGELDEAKGLLALAFGMDDSLRAMALEDPDLEPMFGVRPT